MPTHAQIRSAHADAMLKTVLSHFTCFTGTKVHILTLRAARQGKMDEAAELLARANRHLAATQVHANV